MNLALTPIFYCHTHELMMSQIIRRRYAVVILAFGEGLVGFYDTQRCFSTYLPIYCLTLLFVDKCWNKLGLRNLHGVGDYLICMVNHTGFEKLIVEASGVTEDTIIKGLQQNNIMHFL